MGDAVALVLITEDRRYVLQHRDDKEGIWYPNKWGCFGGGTNKGEIPLQALEREIIEEIGFALAGVRPLFNLDFDMSDSGGRVFYRRYYEAVISDEEIKSIQIGEGRTFGFFSVDELDSQVELVPYDAFALIITL